MNNPKKSSNNVTYTLRIVAGIYLLYLDYSLLKDWQHLDNKIFFVLFMTAFAVIALLLIGFSLKSILKNKYHQNQDAIEQVESNNEKEKQEEQELLDNQQEEEKLSESQQYGDAFDDENQGDSKDSSKNQY